MAAQSPKTPVKGDARESKRGVKNPFIYAGTIVVLVLVVIAFVFLPMGSGASIGSANISFGQYAGKSIDFGQDTRMSQQARSLESTMRQQGLTPEVYPFYWNQVYYGAFQRTVIYMGVLDAMDRAGGRVTEDWLNKAMTRISTFQENGVFSHELYQKASLASKLSIRKDLREGNLYQYFSNDVLGLQPSSMETDFIKEMAKDQRSIEYAAYPFSAYPDSEVAAWGRANSALFRVLKLSRVTIESSEAEALKLHKNIKSGAASFEDVAKASSKDSSAEKGGVMDSIYAHELEASLAVKADADAVAALGQGEISKVYKTAAGAWSFFRADAAAAEADFSDSAVLEKVREYMDRSERGAIEDWVVAKAKEISAAGGASFESSAKKAGLEIKSAGPFPINYGDLSAFFSEYGQRVPLFKTVDSADELAGASTSEQFLTAVFALEAGAVSEPIILGDNAIVVKVKEVVQAKDEDLGGVDFVYSRLFQEQLSVLVQDYFMKSPKLRNNFDATYRKYIYSQTEAAQES